MNLNRDQLLVLIALMVAVVWSITALVSLIIRDYAALTITTTVMLPVATFLFAVRRNGGGDK